MIEYYAPKYNAGGSVHTSARLGVSDRSGTGENWVQAFTIDLTSCSLSNGTLYFKTQNPAETECAMRFSPADGMICDKPLPGGGRPMAEPA